MSAVPAEILRKAGLDVSRETLTRLERFAAEFQKWNQRINLAAASTIDDIWSRHILDSAQILPLGGNALRWLDLGSGGGFPGAVLGVMLKEREGARIDLVESHAKKCAFLTTVLGGMGAPARVHSSRIEDVAVEGVVVVTARALAPLGLLLRLSQPWLSKGARGLFHKGRDYRAEIAQASADWQFDLVEHRSVVDAESIILEISGLRPRQANS